MADDWAADATEDTAATDLDAVANGGSHDPQPLRENKINKKRLEGQVQQAVLFLRLEPNAKMLSIIVRTAKSGLVLCESIKNVPQDVATICSDFLFQKLQRNPKYLLTIEEDELEEFEFVFNWIKQCGEQKTVVNIENVNDLITEEKGFQPLIQAMTAAHKLKIPEASFAKFILKQAKNAAKHCLVDLELVKQAYDPIDPSGFDALGLREVFVQSIFNCWYNYKLDGEEFDEYMAELTDLRHNIPDLDEDLHSAVHERDKFLKAMRERKKAKLAEAENGVIEGADDLGGGRDEWAGQDASAGDGAEWDNGGGNADNFGTGASNEWADEVNKDLVPAPSVAAAIW
ncbi:hypothetical protein LTR05_005588 [Lithohypha guttulata]|uniref:Uncharacterized protein n=1 Tax=Lithohypha guttulata TaxID=1690604 RepID=A0AAN7SZ19_9EURO|nr:hypothetical protein LTR05_005588 [Lithohypha guttulata]